MGWRNDQVGEKETGEIIRIARECLEIKGDFVEMGCYKGDTSLLLAEVLGKYNKNVEYFEEENCENNRGGGCGKPVENFGKKRLWIYDSFEGLPEKTEADKSVLGEDFRRGELFVTKRAVKERFLRAGLPVPVIKKAWFADLTEADLPEQISFAFLDGDLYESIRDCLRLVVPKMEPGGAILVHDYRNPALPGVKKAVDEVFSEVKTFESLAVIWV